MKFWKSAEWQRISKLRGLKLLLVGIAVIPSIYAVIFLSSIWDTYGRLDHLPVAIVNNDQPAKINDKTQHLGQDLTDKVIARTTVKVALSLFATGSGWLGVWSVLYEHYHS